MTPITQIRRRTGIKKSAVAFTLIELVIVVTILAILAAVAIPAFQNMQRHARNAAAKGIVGAIREAIQQYRMNEIVSRRQPGTPGDHPANGCPNLEINGTEVKPTGPWVLANGLVPDNPWARGVVPAGTENHFAFTLPAETRGYVSSNSAGWNYNRYNCDAWANSAANGGVNDQNDPNPTENWY